MAQQTINIGTAPNDGTGTPLRTSFDYCNLNFTELYTAVGPSGNNIVVPGTATITGDLTVARWLVSGGSLPGVGNANPFAYRIGGGGLGIGAATETGTTAPIVFYCGAGGVEQYRIAPLGVNTWSDGAGGTRMALNSTGLGVGIAPIYKFHVKSDLSELYFRDNGTASELVINSETGGASALYFGDAADTVRGGIRYDSSVDTLNFQGYNNISRLIIDSVGNVGIGVSAFGTSAVKVLGLANATAPSTSPVGMGQLYVEAGALKYRGSSGTVTTIANA
jgi:hypothetical protein